MVFMLVLLLRALEEPCEAERFNGLERNGDAWAGLGPKKKSHPNVNFYPTKTRS